MTELNVDPNRKLADTELGIGTGIFVRAKLDGKWGSYDLGELDKPSLHAWLRSRGGENSWAEDTVAILLGHGAFSTSPADLVEGGGLLKDIFEEKGRVARESIAAGKCGCWRCFAERGETPMHMVLCPECGNKRCPKASDHRLLCTRSNEPGQPGSVY